ncbi:hypothetical protein PUNSTDRAFT_145305, partial [Punctularia strigosozonata HHB-11173 SS5]|uniref:uncharacterized protein n=1 Tax=Punctularia strigosozonata (strain HHB-11173) TaxID=741275 RepID=UPI0004416A6D
MGQTMRQQGQYQEAYADQALGTTFSGPSSSQAHLASSTVYQVPVMSGQYELYPAPMSSPTRSFNGLRGVERARPIRSRSQSNSSPQKHKVPTLPSVYDVAAEEGVRPRERPICARYGKLEEHLSLWIDKKLHEGVQVTNSMIHDKAQVLSKNPDYYSSGNKLGVSHKWMEQFRKRDRFRRMGAASLENFDHRL